MIRYSELPSELRFVVLKVILDDGPLPATGRPSSPAEDQPGHREDPDSELTQVMFVGSLIQQHFVHSKDDSLKGDRLSKALLTCLAQTFFWNLGISA